MVTWTIAPFDALDAHALYEVLSLRQHVFVVEQRCVYLDCDGLDARSLHLLGRIAGSTPGVLAAYARLLPPGLSFAEASIGRVATDPAMRRAGLGRALMNEAIARAREAFGGPLRIGAQRYLERFYAELGFVTASDEYDEDGIPHIEMTLAPDVALTSRARA